LATPLTLVDERVLFRDVSCEAEEKAKGKLRYGCVVNARGICYLDTELLCFGEIYLIEPDTVLADYLCSRSGGFKNFAVKIILATQERVESVSIPNVGEKLVLIERSPRFNYLPPRVLQLTDVITRGINEARG
jgi:hypothetical protein